MRYVWFADALKTLVEYGCVSCSAADARRRVGVSRLLIRIGAASCEALLGFCASLRSPSSGSARVGVAVSSRPYGEGTATSRVDRDNECTSHAGRERDVVQMSAVLPPVS